MEVTTTFDVRRIPPPQRHPLILATGRPTDSDPGDAEVGAGHRRGALHRLRTLCVEACGPACLEMVDNIAVLVRPDQCGSEEHGIAPCRDDAIRMDWVPMDGNHWVGRWLHNTGTREKTVT